MCLPCAGKAKACYVFAMCRQGAVRGDAERRRSRPAGWAAPRQPCRAARLYLRGEVRGLRRHLPARHRRRIHLLRAHGPPVRRSRRVRRVRRVRRMRRVRRVRQPRCSPVRQIVCAWRDTTRCLPPHSRPVCQPYVPTLCVPTLCAPRCAACNGVLRDTLLDWEDPLPEDELDKSEDHCRHATRPPTRPAPSAPPLRLPCTPRRPPHRARRADLVLTLGTSLRIEPAGSLPQLGRKFCVVNLQKTPKDSAAALIVRAPVDVVMETIMREAMGLRLRLEAGGVAEWVACDAEPD